MTKKALSKEGSVGVHAAGVDAWREGTPNWDHVMMYEVPVQAMPTEPMEGASRISAGSAASGVAWELKRWTLTRASLASSLV